MNVAIACFMPILVSTLAFVKYTTVSLCQQCLKLDRIIKQVFAFSWHFWEINVNQFLALLLWPVV